MPAPEIIKQLVENFNENREGYRSGKYNEAQLRLEFLNPFFEALGWDIYNKNGWAPENRDVVIEDSLDFEEASKKPDYTFKLGRERKFFVEAKKPKVDIQYDIHPAFQLRRYAWNAHLALSVLTDFEEFAIYNCKGTPSPTDSAATSREKFYRYTDYIEKWDEIAGILSKDAVWKGAFDRYAESSKGKKGTTEVDDKFLKDMSEWRNTLARNIALRNPQLANEAQLNYAVQMTIDRIIFLRICEDRGIEPEEQLKTIASKAGIYAQLVELFKRADVKYNSGLFHFVKEKGNGNAADSFTPGLKIDDKVLKEIISSIYYPCPYIFKEIPVEILGQVYEQFLGKVIRLTAGHQAKVEEKPEVRKAGGVYYTPRYIVDYIVQNTVGKLLEGKTPEGAAKLKIVDPACGSGSFLLGAYQHLLDWHLKWYTENDAERWAKGRNPALVQVIGGYRLTTEKKKEILVNNIHGVDIDAQAVEVTKLSLLLKVLEEESGQLSLGFERVLPDLGKNIQCGNSLIGEDYFEGRLAVDPEERRRVNPFEWQRAFPGVFSQGGFDAVIGNPPYGANFTEEDKKYLTSVYFCQTYQLDSYLLFIERSMKNLLNLNGLFGMIFPNPWLTNILQTSTRKYIVETTRIIQIVHFSYPVFPKVTVDTEIVILQKANPNNSFSVVRILDSTQNIPYEKNIMKGEKRISHNQDLWKTPNGDVINIFLSEREFELKAKIKSNKAPLSEFFVINVGIKPYQTKKGKPPQTRETVEKRPFDSDHKINETYREYLRGSDIHRFNIHPLKMRFISYGPWLAEPRPSANFDAPIKIFMRQTGDSLIGAIDSNQYLCLNNMHILVPNQNLMSIYYFLGVINSNLLNWYYQAINPEVGEALAEVKKTNVEKLPIRIINSSNHMEVIHHDRLVSLVERMIELHKLTPATPQEQERLAREIESTDREIDRLVYELYGLSAEEIRIVEGN